MLYMYINLYIYIKSRELTLENISRKIWRLDANSRICQLGKADLWECVFVFQKNLIGPKLFEADWQVMRVAVCCIVCCSMLQCGVVQCAILCWRRLIGRLCVWQCVAVCCIVMECVAVCWHMNCKQDLASQGYLARVQCVEVCCSVLQCVAVCLSVLHSVAVCCSLLQSVAVCHSVLQCVAVCCSVLQCVAVCCSVLQCVAVCCLMTAISIGTHLNVSVCHRWCWMCVSNDANTCQQPFEYVSATICVCVSNYISMCQQL